MKIIKDLQQKVTSNRYSDELTLLITDAILKSDYSLTEPLTREIRSKLMINIYAELSKKYPNKSTNRIDINRCIERSREVIDSM